MPGLSLRLGRRLRRGHRSHGLAIVPLVRLRASGSRAGRNGGRGENEFHLCLRYSGIDEVGSILRPCAEAVDRRRSRCRSTSAAGLVPGWPRRAEAGKRARSPRVRSLYRRWRNRSPPCRPYRKLPDCRGNDPSLPTWRPPHLPSYDRRASPAARTAPITKESDERSRGYFRPNAVAAQTSRRLNGRDSSAPTHRSWASFGRSRRPRDAPRHSGPPDRGSKCPSSQDGYANG